MRKLKSFEQYDVVNEYFAIDGEVIEAAKISTTAISSSGGGGYISRYGGHVSAPVISSSTSTEQDIYYRDSDGAERAVQVSGCNVPLRAGHRITLIYAKRPISDAITLVVIVNHSLDSYWIVCDLAKLCRDIGPNVPNYYSPLPPMILIGLGTFVAVNGGYIDYNLVDFGLTKRLYDDEDAYRGGVALMAAILFGLAPIVPSWLVYTRVTKRLWNNWKGHIIDLARNCQPQEGT